MVKWKLYVVISALFNETNVIVYNTTDLLLEIYQHNAEPRERPSVSGMQGFYTYYTNFPDSFLLA